MGDNPEAMIKKAISETIVEELLRDLGFLVLKIGKEHTVSPLTQIEKMIERCGGKLRIEKHHAEDYVYAIKTVNKLPDFATVFAKKNKEKNIGEVDLIEVKFRTSGNIWKADRECLLLFPECFMIVVNPGLSESQINEILKESNEVELNPLEKIENLVNTKFHVWYDSNEGIGPKERISICSLKHFLKKEFEIDVEDLFVKHVFEKYEKNIEDWFNPLDILKQKCSNGEISHKEYDDIRLKYKELMNTIKLIGK